MQNDVAIIVHYVEHDTKLTLNAIIWFSTQVERYFVIK